MKMREYLKNHTMKFLNGLDSFVGQYLGKKCAHHNKNTKKYLKKENNWNPRPQFFGERILVNK